MMTKRTHRWPDTLLLLLLTLMLSVGQVIAQPSSAFGHANSQAMMHCDHPMEDGNSAPCGAWDNACPDSHCHLVNLALPASSARPQVVTASKPERAPTPALPDPPLAMPWVIPIR